MGHREHCEHEDWKDVRDPRGKSHVPIIGDERTEGICGYPMMRRGQTYRCERCGETVRITLQAKAVFVAAGANAEAG